MQFQSFQALFRYLSCLQHCPAATIRHLIACAAKKLIHCRTDLLPPSVLPLPDSDHDTSTAVGKISGSSTQPHKKQPNRPQDAPSRVAQRSGRHQAFRPCACLSCSVSPRATSSYHVSPSTTSVVDQG